MAIKGPKGPRKAFDFKDYVEKKDYVGALAILELRQCDSLSCVDRLLWIAFCAFRLGDYSRSKEVYSELLSSKQDDVPNALALYLAITHFYEGSYPEAERVALSFPDDSELKNRILLHIARVTDDETKVAKYRQHLRDTKQDELSAATIELYRCHYKETADIYERMIAEHSDDLALNVYLAVCYYKMDCYDLSLEALSVYSQAFPDSTLAANVHACNVFRLCDGKAALEVLESHCNDKTMEENDLILHNKCVFNDGEKALSIFPGLVGKVHEARLNLAIHYLRHGEVEAAAEIMDTVEANCPQSHAVLGALNAEIGRMKRCQDTLERARSHFQSVGNSPTECDTILGRQCMASNLILLKQYDDVMVYLDSIKSYLGDDDVFKWNYGITLAASGKYTEGLEILLSITHESFKTELAYILWLAKCYIMTGATAKAWECLDTDDNAILYEVLQLIANECYKIGEDRFLFAARSFKELFGIDKFPDYLNGLIGASIGFFRHVVMKMQCSTLISGDLEALSEVVEMLQGSKSPKCQSVSIAIQNWRAQHA